MHVTHLARLRWYNRDWQQTSKKQATELSGLMKETHDIKCIVHMYLDIGILYICLAVVSVPGSLCNGSSGGWDWLSRWRLVAGIRAAHKPFPPAPHGRCRSIYSAAATTGHPPAQDKKLILDIEDGLVDEAIDRQRPEDRMINGCESYVSNRVYKGNLEYASQPANV
eukprot:scaffold340838_cov53-Prasinocladus_malaysianus.AAC.4